FEENQSAILVGRDHFQILRGHAGGAHVTGHLLAFENLARILTLAGGTMRAMRHGDTVRGAHTAEVVPLHRAGKAFTDARADNIDILIRDEVIRRQLRTDIDKRVFRHAELGHLHLRLDFRLGEMAAQCPRHILDFGRARTELDGIIAMAVRRAMRDALTYVNGKNSHRNMCAVFRENPGHAQLFCDQSTTHLDHPNSLMDTSTPAARSSFMSASTVCGVGSTISRRRLWVRISNCSRDFLSICGPRRTVYLSMCVGSGMGPRTFAPVRFAVFT